MLDNAWRRMKSTAGELYDSLKKDRRGNFKDAQTRSFSDYWDHDLRYKIRASKPIKKPHSLNTWIEMDYEHMMKFLKTHRPYTIDYEWDARTLVIWTISAFGDDME